MAGFGMQLPDLDGFDPGDGHEEPEESTSRRWRTSPAAVEEDLYRPSDGVEGLMASINEGLEDDEDTFSDYLEPDGLYREEDPLKGFSIDLLIAKAVSMGASDLHIQSGRTIGVRVNGDLVRDRSLGVVDAEVLQRVYAEITSHQAQQSFANDLELDTSYTVRTGPAKGRRLRLNVMRTLGSIGMVFRLIEDTIPTPEQLGVDRRIVSWVKAPSGLVLVGGPTGSGKDLHGSTMIPTPTGLRPLDLLEEGSLVLDENGEPCRVTDIHPGGSERFFILRTQDGTTVNVGGNHLWPVRDASGSQELCTTWLSGQEVSALTSFALEAGPWATGSMESVLGLLEGARERARRYLTSRLTAREELPLRKMCVLLLEDHQMRAGNQVRRRCGEPVLATTQDMFESQHLADGTCRWHLPLMTAPAAHGHQVSKDTVFKAARSLLSGAGRHDHLWTKVVGWDPQSRAMLADLLLPPAQDGTRVFRSPRQVPASVVHRLSQTLGMRSSGIQREGGGWKVEVSHGLNPVVSIAEVQGDPCRYMCLEVDSESHLYLCTEGYLPTHNSTTFASLIRQIQLTQPKHIVTIEKPVEYVYPDDGLAKVTQREVGSDTRSFANAITSAMRQDPDVLLVGEVRNSLEVEGLLQAAETGHLSLSTIHMRTPAAAVNRVMSLFEGEDQRRVLSMMGGNLIGVANQVLLKTPDGRGRFAVQSVLEADRDVRELISQGDARGIEDLMRSCGSTMEHRLAEVLEAGGCTYEDARSHAPDGLFFDSLVRKGSAVA